jgi:hypothetical protein
MAEAQEERGSMSSEELASKTGTVKRCVREWLANQAAGSHHLLSRFSSWYFGWITNLMTQLVGSILFLMLNDRF